MRKGDRNIGEKTHTQKKYKLSHKACGDGGERSFSLIFWILPNASVSFQITLWKLDLFRLTDGRIN
jgi:hypothetical protein